MKYWICKECALIHSEKTTMCSCGNDEPYVFGNATWLHFNSVEALEKWIKLMRERMGAKVKYAGD